MLVLVVSRTEISVPGFCLRVLSGCFKTKLGTPVSEGSWFLAPLVGSWILADPLWLQGPQGCQKQNRNRLASLASLVQLN